jgi:hypothetical protein
MPTVNGHAIKEEGGAALTQRANLNFVGSSVTATDDAGNNATVITITDPASSVESSYLITEDLTSQVSGATAHFDLTYEALAKCLVYCNLRQQPADVTMDADMLGFTLSFTPTTADKLIVDYYLRDAATLFVYDEADSLVVDENGDYVLTEV